MDRYGVSTIGLFTSGGAPFLILEKAFRNTKSTDLGLWTTINFSKTEY